MSFESDHSKQFIADIVDLTLALPRLLLLRPRLRQRLALALPHRLDFPRKDIRRRDMGLIVQPTLDVERHVYRRGGSQNACERRGRHFVVVEAAPLLVGLEVDAGVSWGREGGKGGRGKRMAHCVLETREARVVPVIDLAFVIDHCKELVIVESLWAWISTRKRG
jgi:hypothetical protein